MRELEALVSSFVDELSARIEGQVMSRVRANVNAVFGGHRRSAQPLTLTIFGRPRKQMPPQLCPVPGCKNLAAPVFGMVCSDHKSVSKKKIREYREARREAKKESRKPARRDSATKPAARTRKPRKVKTKASPSKRTARPITKRTRVAKRAARSARPVASSPSAAPASPPNVAAAG